MNWNRAKSILIVFFMLINVCLLVILLYTRHQVNTISDRVIHSTAALLSQHSIQISDEMIPKKRSKNQNYNLTTILFEENENIEKWLGKEYISLDTDLSEHHFIYRNQDKILEINKTNIHYYVDKSVQSASPLDDKDMKELFSSKLKRFGFKSSEFYFSSVCFENGLYHAVISPLAEKTEITGIKLTLLADSEEIIDITGNWFIFTGKESFGEERLLDITAVITNMIYLENKPMSDLEKMFCAAHVPQEYIENKIVTAVPIYVFQFTDGTKLYYDARSGELIE